MDEEYEGIFSDDEEGYGLNNNLEISQNELDINKFYKDFKAGYNSMSIQYYG